MPTTLPAVAFYLAPPLAISLLLGLIQRANMLFALLVVPGTLTHELLHTTAGWLLRARPCGLSLWPQRLPDGRYRLGGATFLNIRWWNAAPVALAPLTGLPLAVWLASLRVGDGWVYAPSDMAVWGFLTLLLYSSWPSAEDWRMCRRSWPMLFAAPLIVWIYSRFTG
jgi:hypothetical protein